MRSAARRWGHGPFRGRKRLMMMSGSGASSFATECGRAATQPIDRGHHDHRPSGTSPARRTGPGTCKIRSGRRVAPVERRAIDPNAVKDHSDLARNCDLCLFHTDPLRELHSPGLEGRPFFGPIEKDGRCLE